MNYYNPNKYTAPRAYAQKEDKPHSQELLGTQTQSHGMLSNKIQAELASTEMDDYSSIIKAEKEEENRRKNHIDIDQAHEQKLAEKKAKKISEELEKLEQKKKEAEELKKKEEE